MGVHGLWRLIEPSGKPVPVESLENKILAVDVSIWLHQAIKGFHDAKGAPALNAHLLGIFHRVCKLLYFKIKPVFVFDGGVPVLKRQTIAKRHQLKHKNLSEADKIQKQLLESLMKHSAVSKVLGEKAKSQMAAASSSRQERSDDDLFKLPKTPIKKEEDSSDEDCSSPTKNWNLHNIDTKSKHFQSLPADVRHEILTELKETRKQSSWGRLHELPSQSDDFSGFQVKRLLKRQEVQAALEEAEKEMGGHSLSLVELEEILKDQGVISKNEIGNRIASDESKRYLYIRDVKQALEKARRAEEKKKLQEIKEENEEKDSNIDVDEIIETKADKDKADLELEADMQKAIALSLQEQPSSSGEVVKKKLSDFSFLENFDDYQLDSDEEDSIIIPKNSKLGLAQNYMMEYTNLPPNEIARIIAGEEKVKTKKRKLGTSDDETNKTEAKQRKEDNEVQEPRLKKMKISKEEDSKKNGNSSTIQEIPKKLIEDNILEADVSMGVISTSEESDNDFEEVKDISEEKGKNTMEIKIETEKFNEEDDLFADIFVKKDERSQQEKDTNSKKSNVAKENIKEPEMENRSDESENDFEDVEEISEDKDKNVMEIKIGTKEFDEKDDLFADIFEKKNEETELNKSIIKINNDKKEIEKNEGKSEQKIEKKSEESKNDFEEVKMISEDRDENMMEIKIGTKEFDEKDDLFADIFQKKDEEMDLNKSDTKIDNEEKEIENKNEEKNELLQDLIEKAEKIRNKESDSQQKDNLERQRSEDQVKLTEKDLENLRDGLNDEVLDLRNEQGFRERLGTNITDKMYQEAQELLELFGLPYVVAPMEAEAQCAFLETASLTDGTITDDSDIWLFGGKTVYKNFFNQSKHVLEYRAEDIKHHFKLTREQMILLALLVGSDYTTGLQGVGPVTAMEILANFPPSSTSSFTLSHKQLLVGLSEFKSWFMGGKTIARGKNSLRNNLKNVTFTEGFPSMQVVEAYLNPTVDDSEEKFSWTKPDIVALVDFGREKFGWSKLKTEEILKPVIKRMKESRYQSTLLNYFKIKHDLNAEEAQKLMSERVRSAVKRIGQDPKEIEDSDDTDEQEPKKSKKQKKTETNPTKKKPKPKKKDIKELLSDDDSIDIDQIEAILEKAEKEKVKRGRKKPVKHYKLLEKAERVPKTNEVQIQDKELIESTNEDPTSILQNEEMNLLIKVLSNQEASTSEQALKIAKIKKVSEKIEKLKHPELKEAQGSTIEQKKTETTPSKKEPKTKASDIKEVLSGDDFIEINQIEAIMEKSEKGNVKKGRKKPVKHYKLLEKPEEVPKTNEEIQETELIESKNEDPNSILQNEEMNLLIKVLSNQEPSTSEQALKIAKIKKVAEKIEKLKNPELNEEGSKTELKKTPKKSKKIEDAVEEVKKESNLEKIERIAKQLKGKSVVKREEKKQIRRRKPKTVQPSTSKAEDNIDEELKLIKETETLSEKRVKDIEIEAEKMIQFEMKKKKLIERKLHRKEIIPQKERAQKNLLNSRLKAIEVFRKSKIDPTSKKGGARNPRAPKEDAELSESSSDSDL